MELETQKKKFKFLNNAKQIAGQLLLHRMWNGLSQEKVAEVIDVTFQQYQKVEKCENRCLAEQLLAICDNYNWDPRTILKADPVQTLDAWVNRRKPKNRPNIVNNPEKIREKLDKLNDNAYRWYFKNKKERN
jgi:transcriptional regulator with XRE-family HTH domain|tara:strand:+ start:100 stop:495 length:396 start_codon:yes stop_codon:yes gene_type:complete